MNRDVYIHLVLWKKDKNRRPLLLRGARQVGKTFLYYWARDAKNSSAELDYLIQKEGKVIPIEVKSGSTGRLKSLQIFMNQFDVTRGIKISEEKYIPEPKIMSLPFYCIEMFIR